MEFEYRAKDDCYDARLDEGESEIYTQGEYGKFDIDYMVLKEIGTRNIRKAVYVFLENGEQVSSLKPEDFD